LERSWAPSSAATPKLRHRHQSLGQTKVNTASTSNAAATGSNVDVAAILDKAVAKKSEQLAWRTSIVDLMKALDVDSSLSARKELAKDLGYPSDMNNSAAMNIWLHKQMMAQLAANGGKLPADLTRAA
jgi:hypothetical protein